jgi:hypothetical protein
VLTALRDESLRGQVTLRDTRSGKLVASRAILWALGEEQAKAAEVGLVRGEMRPGQKKEAKERS